MEARRARDQTQDKEFGFPMHLPASLLFPLAGLLLGIAPPRTCLDSADSVDCSPCQPQLAVTNGNPCAATWSVLGATQAECVYSSADDACLPYQNKCYGKLQVTFTIGAGRSLRTASGACHDADATGKVTLTFETSPGGPPLGSGCGLSSIDSITICSNPCGGGCGLTLCTSVIGVQCSECNGAVEPI